MLVDQITRYLPKDNKEVNVHVKRLKPMLDATTVADPVYDQEDRDRGHGDDHWESPRGDSASSITPNQCRNREREEQEQRNERDYDYYGPYYDQPHWERSLEVGHIPGGIKAYS
jgi:hypothetical protein